MKDFVSKGQGNSRFLKSSLAVGTSWEDALAALRAGTFPIDLNGVNADGYTQLGTALNKANLLDDTTAAALALGSDPTVNDALAAIAAGFAWKEFASYVGNGTYGSGNECSLTFTFAPTVVIFLDSYSTYQNSESQSGSFAIMANITTTMARTGIFGNSQMYAQKSADGKTLTWYGAAANQLSQSGRTYYFLALA